MILKFAFYIIFLLSVFSLFGKHHQVSGATFQIRGFDSAAYKNGSKFPAYKNNTIRVYGMRFCPYTHRVMLILAAKNLSFELVSINLKDKPDWYRKRIAPLEKIPCVQYNGKIVCGSVLASEWIDDEFDHVINFLPEDPYKRARQKMLLEELEEALPAAHVYKALYFKVADTYTFGSFEIEAAKHEAILKDNYYSGKRIGWVDYMIWPQIEKIELIPLVFKSTPSIVKFPKFTAYLKRMRKRQEVKDLHRPARDHLKYALSLVKQKPDYDIGI